MTDSIKIPCNKTVQRPSLKITIDKTPMGYEACLNDGSDSREPIKIGEGAGELIGEVLLKYRNDLESFRKRLKSRINWRSSPNRVGEALWELNKIGRIMGNKLLGDDGLGRLWEVADKLLGDDELGGPWEWADQRSMDSMMLRLECRTPKEWPIPLDVLPLAPPDTIEPPTDESGVRRLAGVFPAFRAKIRHIISDVPTEKSIVPPLSLLFLWYDGAPSAYGAGRSIAALQHYEPTPVTPDGPFPCNAKFSSKYALAQLLMEQGLDHANSPSGANYSMVHIHAHGETGKLSESGEHTLIGEHTLRFAYRKGGIRGHIFGTTYPIDVTNGDLEVVLRPRSNRAKNGPLIFLNVCGGAAQSYSGGPGLHELFLRYGYRAVIGPRAEIPGNVAEYIARYFYEFLLNECDLAQALLHSRRKLFSEYLNPLGALYTIHGESELRVIR